MADKLKEIVIKNLISVVSIFIALISIGASVLYVKYNECTPCKQCEEKLMNVPQEEIVEEPNKIRIDIKGAVKKPGVYEIDEGSIVNDAILASGGITSSGTTSNINLSKKLKDEMVVYVFTKKELNAGKVENKVTCDVPKCTCEQIVVNKDIEPNNSELNSDTTSVNSKVSINTDSIEELTKLPGIGEAKAKAKIEERKANGNFANIDDIKLVNGISENLFTKIKEYITV